LTGRGPLAGGITHGLARTLRGAWRRPAGHEREMPAAPVISAAVGGNDPVAAERARLRRKASVHGQVAIQISGLMQDNAARCEDLRQRLTALRAAGGLPDASAAAAALGREIQVLDRIIAWQARTVDWHLGEARRLRDQARRVNGPEDPAAAPAPGQTIDAETARRPGGRGQTGEA